MVGKILLHIGRIWAKRGVSKHVVEAVQPQENFAIFTLLILETVCQFCAYHVIFVLRKGPANTITTLSPNVNNANIKV